MASIPLLRLSLRPTTTTTTTTALHHHHRHLPTPPLLFHPLKSTLLIPKPLQNPKTSNSKPPISCSSSSSTTPATDRIVSSIAYILPFLNGLQYGRFLLAQYPKLSLLFQPILPVFALYRSLPYASFVAFFGLYLGVVRNPSFSHYVRFNAMQALVLDVLMVVPLLIQRIFNPGRAGVGYNLMVMAHNGLFLFVVFCFVYSWVSTVLGRTPYLPFVADAAGRQL